MGKKWNKNYARLGVTIVISVCVCMVFSEVLKARASIFATIGKIFSALTPVVIGIVIAFLLNPVMIYARRAITWVVTKIKKNADYDKVYDHTRLPALLFTVVFFLALVFGFFYLMIPSLYTSISDLVQSMPEYLENAKEWVKAKFEGDSAFGQQLSKAVDYLETDVYDYIRGQVMPNLDTIMLKVSSGVVVGLKVVLNFFIGIIVTVYLLYSKDVLLAQGRKMIYCTFNKRTGNKIMRALSYANQVFGGFINGKILDSIIIGILCFVFTSAVGMKYASVISVIVGITNIIPFFGPFIGAVPGSLLALMDDPLMFVIFLVWIIVLQQFDGNILGPLILGDATGLSSLWVLVAILVGGDLFGVMGMVLGVPVFACVYALIAVHLRDGLRAKRLSSKTEDYIRLSGFDERTGEPIYREKHEMRKSLRAQKRKRILYNKLHHIKNDQFEEEDTLQELEVPKKKVTEKETRGDKADSPEKTLRELFHQTVEGTDENGNILEDDNEDEE